MRYADEYSVEETILTPRDTKLKIECFLDDCQFIQSMNREGLYSFSFFALTMNGHQQLCEQVERAVMTVELGKGYDSRKVAQPKVENRQGGFYVSQMFLPKLNVEIDHPSQLYQKQADLSLHLRDDPTGNIFLQCSWVDFFEPIQYPDELGRLPYQTGVTTSASDEVDIDDDW